MRAPNCWLAVVFVLGFATVVKGDGEQYLLAARRAMRSRDHTTAIENYLKAIAADPANADIHAELGIAYLNMNNLSGADSRLKKAKSIDPKNTVALLGLALLYSRRGEKDKAKQSLKEAEQTGAGRGGGLRGGGENRLEQRLLQQARREVAGATRTEVKGTVSVSRKAAQLIRMGDYKEAVELITPILDDKPESAMLYVWLGKAYQGEGNWTEAKEAFNKAIDLSNGSGSAGRVARRQLKIITGR
ncbi:MAG: tetratricopeptide repeat protein [Planctomycetes bacterium]|nr:tetratricopeptide repeat protein [Planctomycetota bacterium]